MPSDPTILAFDSSAAHCAAALLRGGEIVASAHEEMSRGQGERLAVMVGEVMSEVGAVWEQLDAIGVGVGPGNFTGIRIAVSFARGLALAMGKPAIGVSGFEAMFEAAGRPDGDILICIGAPRCNFYAELFRDGRAAGEPHLCRAPDDAFRHLPRCPDGVIAERERAVPIARDLCPAPLAAPWARPLGGSDWIAPAVALQAGRRLGSPGPRPAPLYIRPPDAAPSRVEAPKIIG